MINLPAAIDRALVKLFPGPESPTTFRVERNAILDEILVEAGGTYRLIRVDERGFDIDPHVEDPDDGIAVGITRRTMLGYIVSSVTGEMPTQYRGERVVVVIGQDRVTVIVDEIGPHRPLVADSMHLEQGLVLMARLDQLIDYLQADPTPGR